MNDDEQGFFGKLWDGIKGAASAVRDAVSRMAKAVWDNPEVAVVTVLGVLCASAICAGLYFEAVAVNTAMETQAEAARVRLDAAQKMGPQRVTVLVDPVDGRAVVTHRGPAKVELTELGPGEIQPRRYWVTPNEDVVIQNSMGPALDAVECELDGAVLNAVAPAVEESVAA